MLRGSAWAARRDQAFALVEDPRQRRLADWKDQRTRRRAELEEKTARREAEFTALISAISAQVAAEVSAAVAAALQTARVGHHEGLNHASTTTSAPTTSVADDHDLNLAPAITSTTTRSVAANYDPTAILTSPAPPSVISECLVREGNLAARPPTTCSMVCAGGGPSSPSAASNPAEPVASSPSISVAVAYSYSSVTGPAPHADIQLVHEDDIQPEAFTGVIDAPPSAAAHKSNLTMETPTTCSTECSEQEDGDPTPVTTSMVICEAAVTTACMACDGCVYPVAQPVVMPATVHVDVVDRAPTMAAPSTDIMLDPRATTPATTKPVSAVELESDFNIASPTTVSVVCLDPVPDVPAAVLTQATLKLMEQQLVCSCVNQLHPICSGMCSGLGCGTIHSVCLLPWDPGKKRVVLTDSARSKEIDSGAYVKELDTDLSGSHVHHHKSGFTKTWTYFHGSIQVFGSSQNAPGKCSSEVIYVELLKNQFDCAGPFNLTACATTYPAMCAALVPFENILLGSLEQEKSGNLTGKCRQYRGVETRPLPWPSFSYHTLHPEASTYLSLAAHSVPYHYAPVTYGNGFLYGHCSGQIQWEIAWLIALDYRAFENKLRLLVQWYPNLWCSVELIHKWMLSFLFVELQSWTSHGIILLVSEVLRIASGHCHRIMMLGKVIREGAFNLQLIGKLQKMQVSTALSYHSGPPRLFYCFPHAQTLGIILINYSSPRPNIQLLDLSGLHWMHSSCEHPLPESFPLYIAWLLSVIPCAGSDFGVGGNITYMCLMIEIVWPLDVVFSATGNKSVQLFYPTRERYEGYLEKRSALLPHISSRTVQALLLGLSQYCHHGFQLASTNHNLLVEANGSKYSELTPWPCLQGKTARPLFRAPLQPWVSYCTPRMVALHNSEPLQGHIQQQEIGNFQLITVNIRLSFPACYRSHYLDHDYYLDVFPHRAHIDHDYYIGVFLEQVRAVGYLNLVKVCLDYDIHRDFRGVMTHQVSWDPGGSTRHRLEVKPKIKEGGMLATLLPDTWAATVGPQPARKAYEEWTDIYQQGTYRKTRVWNGRLRPPSLLSSSSSHVPLFL